MFRAFFAAKRGRENQLIVALGSIKRFNPDWNIVVYYDDYETKIRLEDFAEDWVEFRPVKKSNILYCLDELLQSGAEGRAFFFEDNTLCNRTLEGLSNSPIENFDAVIRPEYVFQFVSGYGKYYYGADPNYNGRAKFTRSYFNCDMVGFNLDNIRKRLPWQDMVSAYESNLDKYPTLQDYVNEFFAGDKYGAIKGLMPGSVGLRPDHYIHNAIPYSTCLRHNVRLLNAATINFSGPITPWTEGKQSMSRLHLQIPYRHYLNTIRRFEDHLDEDFIEAVEQNTLRWLERFGTLDKDFAKAFVVRNLDK